MTIFQPLAVFALCTCFNAALYAEGPFVFRDVAEETGLKDATRGMMAHSVAWGDVDRDGKIDLWIGTFADRKDEVYKAGGADGPVPNMLFMQRNGKFEKVDNPEIAWKGRATGSVFVDFDNDGWDDLYVSNNGQLGKENLLYHNNQGKLELVTDKAAALLQLPEVSRGVGVFDLDGNGLLDLLVLSTPGKGESLLFQNQGKMRFKVSKALPSGMVGLSVATGDINGDTLPDVFVGGPNRLFVNMGGGKFREATEFDTGVNFKDESNAASCGAAFGDFDRDGRMDLLIGTHTRQPWETPVPMRLFRNLGSTKELVRFEEVTEQVGLRPLPMKTPHVEIRDFDNDGWPDLYSAIVIFKDGKTYPCIYKNLGAKQGELPKFQETAFVHRPQYPETEDFHPKMKLGEYYKGLETGGKLMYFCPGASSDFDGDGRLDFAMPNWYASQASLLLKNETRGGSYLDVQVVGGDPETDGKKNALKLNRNGIGSLVQAYRPGEALLAGGPGFVASEQIATGFGYASGQEPVAHLGLGELDVCDVVVTLPNNQGRIIKRGVKTNQRLRIEANSESIKKSTSAVAWPPRLKGAENGVVTLKSDLFLDVPSDVNTTRDNEGIAPFVMAKTPPTIDLAFHRDLGKEPAARRLWSSWGDICLARDGRVYVGIGDHGDDAGGDGRCFVYRWDPAKKSLQQIVNMNEVIPPQPNQVAWTKIHAKIDEGTDGKIYFCCTLNAGNAAGNGKYPWNEQLPGAQLYQFDPQTNKTSVFANLPPKRCTATSLYDAKHNVWWCNLEAGKGDALFGLNLSTKQVIYQGEDGSVGFNRSFAMANDGSIYFNGPDQKIQRLEPKSKQVSPTGVAAPDSPGMRASTRESSAGVIYGVTHKSSQLFQYQTATNKLELLGPTWGKGEYTSVIVLSPDERFLYYLPGAHGQAFRYGTPIVQYEIATKRRKVLAFLAPALQELIDYVPGGTYGIKLSEDGGTLYVNFNGHAADEIRVGKMAPIGFGLCSFVAIHIPPSER